MMMMRLRYRRHCHDAPHGRGLNVVISQLALLTRVEIVTWPSPRARFEALAADPDGILPMIESTPSEVLGRVTSCPEFPAELYQCVYTTNTGLASALSTLTVFG